VKSATAEAGGSSTESNAGGDDYVNLAGSGSNLDTGGDRLTRRAMQRARRCVDAGVGAAGLSGGADEV
jgi:hypothetical protein